LFRLRFPAWSEDVQTRLWRFRLAEEQPLKAVPTLRGPLPPTLARAREKCCILLASTSATPVASHSAGHCHTLDQQRNLTDSPRLAQHRRAVELQLDRRTAAFQMH